MINEMELKFKATLANELLARQSVVAFIAPLNPTFDEIGEIKTIISWKFILQTEKNQNKKRTFVRN